MTELKQRIVDLVRRAGRDGISGDDLFALAYEHRELLRYPGSRHNRRASRKTLKAHIWQINRELKGYRIVGSHARGGWYWWSRSDS